MWRNEKIRGKITIGGVVFVCSELSELWEVIPSSEIKLTNFQNENSFLFAFLYTI